jgi:hypothetical protein
MMTKPTSEQVTFLAAGSGATQRTALEKFRDVVSVKDFGAVGDGIADDRAAIIAAIAAVPVNGTIYFPDGRFLISSKIFVFKSVNFVGSGQATLVGDGDKIFDVTPATSVLTTTATAIAGNGYTITLASVAGIVPGQILEIFDPLTPWPYDTTASGVYGETNTVRSVDTSTNVVTLGMPVASAYNTGITVKAWTPIEDMRVENLNFERLTKTPNTASGMTGFALKNACISKCTFDGFGATCLGISYSSHTRVLGCSFQNSYYPGIGLGYGVFTSGSVGTLVSGCMSYNARRCVDFSGSIPSRYSMAVGCMAVSDLELLAGASGFGTHGTAEYCTFKSCVVISTQFGFVIRGGNIVLDGCSSHGVSSDFAVCSSGTNHSILNCTCDKPSTITTTPPFPTSGFVFASSPHYTASPSSLVVKNCVADVGSYFVYLNDNIVDGFSTQLNGNSVNIRTNTTDFVQTPALTSAKTFNIFVSGNVGYRLDTNALFRLDMAAGANATLEERTVESWNADYFFSARRTAAPTTGSWRVGDVVWNSAPSAGGTPGWVCTTAGTPGTWKAMSNVAA